jgi:hypothetical protein
MLESRCEADLALEALRAEPRGKARVEDLDGDGTVVAQVAAQEYRGHAAMAKLALDGVPASEPFGQSLQQGGSGHADL